MTFRRSCTRWPATFWKSSAISGMSVDMAKHAKSLAKLTGLLLRLGPASLLWTRS